LYLVTGLCRRFVVVAIVLATLAMALLSPVAASGGRLTPSQRCTMLLDLGHTGYAAYQRWEAATSEVEKSEIVATFYRENRPLVRKLAASPPRPIARDLRSLLRTYENPPAAFSPQGKVGNDIARYVKAECLAVSA
jgi:hypothetical protein